MASNFRIEVASEDDMPSLAALIIPAFAHYRPEILLGNVDTPEGIAAATEHYLEARREYMEETGRPLGVKCIHSDPESAGGGTMAACAFWLVYDRPRSKENLEEQSSLLAARWIQDEEKRAEALALLKPVVDLRVKWLAGRGHLILTYMATDPAWQRRGAATTVVKWGVKVAEELGVPAYLEASEAGFPVYQRLGFESVDTQPVEEETLRIMMWWPPGTKEEDKRPLAG